MCTLQWHCDYIVIAMAHKGSADRHYCQRCGTPLWVSDEQWPELVHSFASVIDTELPKAPSSVHLLLRDKASWVEPQIGCNDPSRAGEAGKVRSRSKQIHADMGAAQICTAASRAL